MKAVNNFVNSEKKLFTDSVRSFLPSYAVIPFNLTKKKDFKCIVQENDVVKEGQVIALSVKEENEKRLYIHAPVPGRVIGFVHCYLPNGGVGIAVKIKMEGSFSYLGKVLPETDWQWFSKENLLDIFTAKGVTNTFDCSEDKTDALARQIENCKLVKNRFLVVRLFDEDPSRMTDTFVAEHYTYQILKGAYITARAMEAQGIVFILPKKSNIKINETEFVGIPIFILEADTQKYPAGFKQNLIGLVKKNAKLSSVEIDKRVAEEVAKGIKKGLKDEK